MVVVSLNSTRCPGLPVATGKPGHLVEFNDTTTIFENPEKKETEDYIAGRFG